MMQDTLPWAIAALIGMGGTLPPAFLYRSPATGYPWKSHS
jgi:hypothetical protein